MYTNLIIGFAILLIAIVIAYKTHWNFGMLCLAGALIYNNIFLGGSFSAIMAEFPTRQALMFICTGAFFGYGKINGTFDKLADWMMYKAGGSTKLIPWVIYFISFLLALCGASGQAIPVIVGSIGFSLWDRARFNPVLVPVAVQLGSVSAGFGFWTADAQIRYSYIFKNFPEAEATQITYWLVIVGCIGGLFTFALMYFFLKGWKSEAGITRIEVAPVTTLNEEQKKTATLYLVAIAIIVIPALIQILAPNPVTQWLNKYIDIFFVTCLGSIIAPILGIRTLKDGVNSIPWGIVLIIAGAVILIGLIVDQGFTDLIVSIVEGGIPMWIIPPFFALCTGLISIFATGSVGYALLLPLVTGLQGIGVSYHGMLAGILIPPNMTGCSPFSGGGAAILSRNPDEKVREEMVQPQFAASFMVCGCITVYVLLYSLIAG